MCNYCIRSARNREFCTVSVSQIFSEETVGEQGAIDEHGV